MFPTKEKNRKKREIYIFIVEHKSGIVCCVFIKWCRHTNKYSIIQVRNGSIYPIKWTDGRILRPVKQHPHRFFGIRDRRELVAEISIFGYLYPNVEAFPQTTGVDCWILNQIYFVEQILSCFVCLFVYNICTLR